jgi:hypothetical protein
MSTTRSLWLTGVRALAALALVITAGASLARAQTIRVDVSPGGAPADAHSRFPVISADGRYVAFVSLASNLVDGDTDGSYDFFRFDRVTGVMLRLDAPHREFGDHPSPRAISQDGRWLLFTDAHGDWVAGDTNDAPDVFQADFATGAIRRVSVGSGGVQANCGSSSISMSLDGRLIVFDSCATTLGPPEWDNGPQLDVFLHDAQTGDTTQLTRSAGGGPANGHSLSARLSPDGEWVLFSSAASNLTAEPDTNGVVDAYLLHWRTGETFRVGPLNGEPSDVTAGNALTWDAGLVAFTSFARNMIPDATTGGNHAYTWDRLGGFVAHLPPFWTLPPSIANQVDAVEISLRGRYALVFQPDPQYVRTLVLHDRLLQQRRVIAAPVDGLPHMSLDGRAVVYERADGIYVQTIDVPSDGLLPTADADADGLPNGWEQRFGLDPESAAASNGADGDPDQDGRTNAEEFAAHSHPRGLYRRYLAEGAGGSFFQTRLALLNVTSPASHVLLRFLRDDGVTITQDLVVLPGVRRTVDTVKVAGLEGASFSTVIESDVPVVVDRTMTWDGRRYGAHAETSIAAPSQTWYLAEGSTSGPFDLFYLLQNPNDAPATALVRFVRPLGLPPIEKTYTLPPASRTTLIVDTADPALASTDVSAVITSSLPIIVERAMYLSRPGEPFAAGHDGAGVAAPATQWFLAEGATGTFFELFVLLLNPSEQAATCEVRYLTAGGATYVKPYVLPPNSRTTIWVDQENIPGLGQVLADTAVSTLVTSLNGVPIVVERAMWWPDGDWREAHVSAGATAPGRRWGVANGEVGGPSGTETYVLIANTSAVAGQVNVSVILEDGRWLGRIYTVPASSRFNVSVGQDFSDAVGRRFSVLVEAGDLIPVDLVVESAMYWNANGVVWAAGTNAPATRLPYP